MTYVLLTLGCYTAVFPTAGAYLTPKLLAVAAAVVWGVWQRDRGTKPLTTGFALVFAANLLSACFADSPVLALAGYTNEFSAGLSGVALMWLCYEAGGSESEWAKPLAWGVALTALTAISQRALGWPMVSAELPTGSRAYGLAGSPPFLGCMLALAAPLLWGGGTNRREDWLLRALIAIGIFLTASRAAFIGYATGLGVLLLGYRRAAFWGLVAALIGAVAAGTRTWGSDSMRLEIWKTGLVAVAEKPFFGWGPSGFGDAFLLLRDVEAWGWRSLYGVESAHNVVLDVLVFSGAVGLAAWVFLGYALWRRGLNGPKQAALTSVLVYGMFNPIPFTAWCVLAFVIGVEREA